MTSHPEPAEVIDALGDKVINATIHAVARTTDDLREYRKLRPDWVAESSERGLANWIHDRLWQHHLVLLEGIEGVALVDTGAIREIQIGINYRVRIKRHRDEGKIASYPTQTALDFFSQAPIVQEVIEGMEQIRLAVGYRWDPDTRSIGAAVISLHDGQDTALWIEELILDEGTGTVTLAPASTDGPTAPTIGVKSDGETNIQEAESQ